MSWLYLASLVLICATLEPSFAQHTDSAAPINSASTAQLDMANCKTKERWVKSEGCDAWAAKKAKVNATECPDKSETACRSFKEMVAAEDEDFMSDLASRNVYVCFRPGEDVFFEASFSEPDELAWMGTTEWRQSQTEEKRSFLPGNYVQFGSAGLTYYTAGVGDEYNSIQGSGHWVYKSFGPTAKPEELKNLATSRNSLFQAKNAEQDFEVQRTRFEASEKYQNQAGIDIEHIVTVQLATGRFRETFQEQQSGRKMSSYSGRCIALPETQR